MQIRFEEQQEFTKQVLTTLGHDMSTPLPTSQKVELTREYILYMISECNDLLAQLDWKSYWKTRKPIIRSNVGIELIDIQKFLWGLARIWDIDADEFLQLYDLKSSEVESKWYQETSLEDLATKEKVCIIDIDGVLTPYPDCFVSWVQEHYDKNFDIEKSDIMLHEMYKHFYRESGQKQKLPYNFLSIKALRELRNLGYTIVLLTNRPARTYKRIYGDTIAWLKAVDIPYDYIFWADDKKILSIIDKCKKIDFVVDDSESTCNEFKQAGIKAYHYGKDLQSLMMLKEIKPEWKLVS